MADKGGDGAGALRLSPISGVSRDGRPLAYHRPPAPDLAPWIARLFVTEVWQPQDQQILCGIFNDLSLVRILVRGHWAAETPAGPFQANRGALLFGPHTRRLPVAVTGSFASFGFALRPGALTVLRPEWGEAAADTIQHIDPAGPWGEWARIDDFNAHSPEHWLHWLEDRLRELIALRGAPLPDPLAQAFDHAVLRDPSMQVTAFAAARGVSTRRVERMARRDFGMTPRHVMRRARVLDMASQILGMADAEEAAEHALRFYDQSHLIRDFRALLGYTPRQLASSPRPMLALSLEPRQARRLEELGMLDGTARAPWR